jgi:curved DNA-binding protein CbpA
MHKSLELFKLDRNFSEQQLKQAYKNLVQVCHPDRFFSNPALRMQAEEKLKQINNAYERLQENLSQQKQASSGREGKRPPVHEQFLKRPNVRSRDHFSRTREPTRNKANGNVFNGHFFTRLCYFLFTLSAVSVFLFIAFNFSFSTNENLIVISKQLDEKYGFNNLKFGMSPKQIKGIIRPANFKQHENTFFKSITFTDTVLNKMGGYSLDSVSCTFLKDRLYRIDISFSKNQNKIFKFLKKMYGTPYENNNWIRERKKLVGKSWEGITVRATILGEYGTSEETTVWDSLVIQEIRISSEARKLRDDGLGKIPPGNQAI